MRQLWITVSLLLAASVSILLARKLPSASNLWPHVQRSCPHQSNCSAAINLQHLQQLRQYMRPELDPCTDFHAYACGNWRNIHGKKRSAMALCDQRINRRYEKLFERLLQNDRASERRQLLYVKLLRYYETCKRIDSDNQRLQLQGYMTVLEQQLPPVEHWLDLLALLGRYGYAEHFVRVSISQHNISQHNVVIQPHNTYESLNLTTALYEALAGQTHQSLVSLRAQFARLESELVDIVELNQLGSDNVTAHYVTLEQLERECPEVNWQRALILQLGVQLSPRHLLLLDELPAIRKLAQYLNNANPTLLRLYSLARFLSYLQQRPHNPVNSAVHGRSCVRHMRKTLYLAMNYAYEQAYYAPQRGNDERIIQRMFQQMQDQFERTLRQNEMQLSAELVQAMLAKLRGVRLNLGNMPIGASEEFFENCLNHLQVGDNFYENHLQSLEHYYEHLSKLERSRDKAELDLWYSFNHHGPELMDNIDETPYFYCLGSIIIIPYAYLQLPLYDAEFWPALLYGDLANTIGHEMLHAFDTYFVDYDANGHMADYSSQLQKNERYVAHVNCLNDSALIFLNERTSDVSGTRLALQTYMTNAAYRRDNGQLFFLQFAQFFCGDDSDDYHESGSKRLNYTLAQMPEFAEVFGCAPGTPMNPPERCSFW